MRILPLFARIIYCTEINSDVVVKCALKGFEEDLYGNLGTNTESDKRYSEKREYLNGKLRKQSSDKHEEKSFARYEDESPFEDEVKSFTEDRESIQNVGLEKRQNHLMLGSGESLVGNSVPKNIGLSVQQKVHNRETSVLSSIGITGMGDNSQKHLLEPQTSLSGSTPISQGNTIYNFLLIGDFIRENLFIDGMKKENSYNRYDIYNYFPHILSPRLEYLTGIDYLIKESIYRDRLGFNIYRERQMEKLPFRTICSLGMVHSANQNTSFNHRVSQVLRIFRDHLSSLKSIKFDWEDSDSQPSEGARTQLAFVKDNRNTRILEESLSLPSVQVHGDKEISKQPALIRTNFYISTDTWSVEGYLSSIRYKMNEDVETQLAFVINDGNNLKNTQPVVDNIPAAQIDKGPVIDTRPADLPENTLSTNLAFKSNSSDYEFYSYLNSVVKEYESIGKKFSPGEKEDWVRRKALELYLDRMNEQVYNNYYNGYVEYIPWDFNEIAVSIIKTVPFLNRCERFIAFIEKFSITNTVFDFIEYLKIATSHFSLNRMQNTLISVIKSINIRNTKKIGYLLINICRSSITAIKVFSKMRRHGRWVVTQLDSYLFENMNRYIPPSIEAVLFIKLAIEDVLAKQLFKIALLLTRQGVHLSIRTAFYLLEIPFNIIKMVFGIVRGVLQCLRFLFDCCCFIVKYTRLGITRTIVVASKGMYRGIGCTIRLFRELGGLLARYLKNGVKNTIRLCKDSTGLLTFNPKNGIQNTIRLCKDSTRLLTVNLKNGVKNTIRLSKDSTKLLTVNLKKIIRHTIELFRQLSGLIARFMKNVVKNTIRLCKDSTRLLTVNLKNVVKNTIRLCKDSTRLLAINLKSAANVTIGIGRKTKTCISNNLYRCVEGIVSFSSISKRCLHCLGNRTMQEISEFKIRTSSATSVQFNKFRKILISIADQTVNFHKRIFLTLRIQTIQSYKQIRKIKERITMGISKMTERARFGIKGVIEKIRKATSSIVKIIKVAKAVAIRHIKSVTRGASNALWAAKGKTVLSYNAAYSNAASVLRAAKNTAIQYFNIATNSAIDIFRALKIMTDRYFELALSTIKTPFPQTLEFQMYSACQFKEIWNQSLAEINQEISLVKKQLQKMIEMGFCHSKANVRRVYRVIREKCIPINSNLYKSYLRKWAQLSSISTSTFNTCTSRLYNLKSYTVSKMNNIKNMACNLSERLRVKSCDILKCLGSCASSLGKILKKGTQTAIRYTINKTHTTLHNIQNSLITGLRAIKNIKKVEAPQMRLKILMSRIENMFYIRSTALNMKKYTQLLLQYELQHMAAINEQVRKYLNNLYSGIKSNITCNLNKKSLENNYNRFCTHVLKLKGDASSYLESSYSYILPSKLGKNALLKYYAKLCSYSRELGVKMVKTLRRWQISVRNYEYPIRTVQARMIHRNLIGLWTTLNGFDAFIQTVRTRRM